MFHDLFDPAAAAEAWDIIRSEFALAFFETLYVTVLATLFAVIIGLPLGVLLVAGEKNGVLPLPRWLMRVRSILSAR